MTTTKFTTDHEWVLIEDGSATVGITDYAQEQLGDVVYVELPEVGQAFTAGDNVAVVESVKAVGEINMPLDGTINAVNESLEDEPELVNGDAMGTGWLFKMTPADPARAGELMDDAAYGEYVSGL
jgi:glycine cleavage system H protein